MESFGMNEAKNGTKWINWSTDRRQLLTSQRKTSELVAAGQMAEWAARAMRAPRGERGPNVGEKKLFSDERAGRARFRFQMRPSNGSQFPFKSPINLPIGW
jgi:hypothetical protein